LVTLVSGGAFDWLLSIPEFDSLDDLAESEGAVEVVPLFRVLSMIDSLEVEVLYPA
jgi:hypothetical protein